MKSLGFIIVAVLLSAIVPILNTTYAECKLPGKDHDDNNPSKKKGDQLMKEGASACELAKKCDSMQIKVQVDNKKELHEKEFYLNAPAKIQKELDESVEKGKGHDSPNLICYELEYSVKE